VLRGRGAPQLLLSDFSSGEALAGADKAALVGGERQRR
jgi:hypothetical protein